MRLPLHYHPRRHRQDVIKMRRDLGYTSRQIEQHMGQSKQQVSLVLDKLGTLDDYLKAVSDSRPILQQLEKLLHAANDARQAVVVTQILDNLHFPTMNDRFRAVRDSAEDTFGWIYDEPELLKERQVGLEITFSDWLKFGAGIFHIEGKPGSGKSTLMKYLCEHDETGTLLGEWAGDKCLISSQFFFWRMGSKEERSLEGLIRGLLSSVIRQVPALAEQLFPTFFGPVVRSGYERTKFIELSDKEVATAFRSLLTRTLHQWTLTSTGGVKLCVSSRQMPVFVNAFPPSQRITIQIFTKQDIERLVEQRLEKNELFQKLSETHNERCAQIVHQILNNADGVFLWVHVLLTQLDDALANCDPIGMLEAIVTQAPKELDEFFGYILKSIQPRYKRHSFALLATAMRLQGTLLAGERKEAKCEAASLIYHETQTGYLSLLSCSHLLEGLDHAALRDVGIDDMLISAALAWMTLVDISFRKNLIEETSTINSPDHESETNSGIGAEFTNASGQNMPDDLWTDEQIKGGNNNGRLWNILLCIRQTELNEPGLLMPILQKIERAVLARRFGASSIAELAESQPRYGILRRWTAPGDSSNKSSRYGIFIMSCLHGLHEFLEWDQADLCSMTRDAGWFLRNCAQSLVEDFYHQTSEKSAACGELLYHSLQSLLRVGVSVETKIAFEFYPVKSLPGDSDKESQHELQTDRFSKLEKPQYSRPQNWTLWNLFVAGVLTEVKTHNWRDESVFSETQCHLWLKPVTAPVWKAFEIWLRHGADPRLTLSWDGSVPMHTRATPQFPDKYPVVNPVRLFLKDENGVVIIRWRGGLMAESQSVERAFLDLLESSEGTITFAEFLRFRKPPNLETLLHLIQENISAAENAKRASRNVTTGNDTTGNRADHSTGDDDQPSQNEGTGLKERQVGLALPVPWAILAAVVAFVLACFLGYFGWSVSTS
ncbi:hypothetical protein GQ53DRAFT_872828 [Thozetella sp. PMI_491]|nr:hypothetical protein GQ53DRAFT_872828 [Thozetella sp. PMI_491]